MPWLTAILAGLLIGVVVGALGAGGGILSVPVLTYVLGQSAHDAAAGSLVIVGLTALVSLRDPVRQGRVHWREGLVFGALSVLGAVAGSRLSVRLDEVVLLSLFSLMLLAVGAFMLVKGLRERRRQRGGKGGTAPVGRSRGLGVVVLAATFTGFLTGFFGVGGGFIVVPMLVFALAFPMREATGTSLVVMVIASTTGLLARIGTGVSVDWAVVLPFALASMCGGLAGGPLTRRLPAYVLTTAFGALLLGVGAATLASVARAAVGA